MRLLIAGLILTYTYAVFGQQYTADIQNLTVDHGLPDNSVYCFYQDQMGFMWIGTHNGITRYDGHSFKQFPIKGNELETYPTIKIIGDAQRLWIATMGAGLYQLNLQTHQLNQFPSESENTAYGNNVSDVFQTNDSSIWIATDQGVFRKKVSDQYFQSIQLTHLGNNIGKTITQIVETDKDQIILASNKKALYSIKSSTVESNSGTIECEKMLTGQNFQYIIHDKKSHSTWMGVWNQGLFAMDSTGLTNFRHQENDKSTLSSNQVTGIALDQVGNVWVGTNDRGINLIRQKTELSQSTIINYHTAGRQHQYLKTADVFNSLTDYIIRSLFVDISGILWIGTQNNGLLKIQLKKEVFKYYAQNTYVDNTLANRDVSYPGITKDGSLWIGTWGGGLHHLTPHESSKEKPQYRRFFPIENDSTSISFSRVFPVKEDSKENLWLGTNGGGINFLSKEEKYKDRPKFVRYQHNSTQKNSLSNNIIRSMLVDSKDRVWAGTDKGLNLLLPDSKSFEIKFENFVIRALDEDVTRGIIWMGTNNNGLVSWNPSLNESKEYKYSSIHDNEVPLLNILDLAVTPSGKLWVGTVDGLFSFDPDTEKFTYCTGGAGTSPRQVESIQIDRHGRLWLGTWENGLFAYEPDKNKFTNFRMTEGRISNSFTEGSSKGSDGSMYFGSRNGFYGFHPDSVLLDEMLPKVLITEIFAGEKRIPESEIYQLNTRQPKPVVFDYDDEIISIFFSGLSFSLNDPIRYAYNLSGIDKQWNNTNVGEQHITYSNLSPGRYIFSVKSVHHSNVGEPAKITIIINPPWWRTWWSYTLFSVLFAFVVFKIRQYRQAKRQEEKDNFRKKIEREKEERLQQIKLEFFTNVSHEIKTPLTLIKAPVENMLNSDQLSPKNKEYAALIKSNTERLMRLTNQLLDYRKVSLSQMPVKNELIDVVDAIQKVCQLFGELANKNEVNFIFQSELSSLMVSLDNEKLESIIFNLLTNAFKHTPKEGRVEVLFTLPENKQLQIEVRDTGSGIPKDKIDQIFNLFYTENDQNNTIQKGTGIGLALVKELTSLMQGQVRVVSEESSGTSFFVSFDIPTKSGNTPPKYIELNRTTKRKKVLVSDRKDKSNGKQLPLLLITEDDPEMNNYIAMQFSDTYQIIQAYNGKQALELLSDKYPELVITDLMMPEMDGIEFCTKIKSDLETSHIPVVMLTAKGQDEEKLQGLKTGADAYLTKPFSPELLKVTIANLIKSRKLLQDKYSKSIQVEPSGITITPVDEKFIQDVLNTVDLHLADSSFTVEQLAREIGSSVPQLYRKVKAITGLGPNECIRDLRLKRAALLLKESGLSISEISYKVGFGNPKYFSRCFSQQFGCSPREFKGKVKA
ncbi:two-component regulator propeller domain-containing protein [Reichenbachiella sp. MALMAid0571]